MYTLAFTITIMLYGDPIITIGRIRLGLFGNYETCEGFRRNFIEGKFERSENLMNVNLKCEPVEDKKKGSGSDDADEKKEARVPSKLWKFR